jgi:hypothetical protein
MIPYLTWLWEAFFILNRTRGWIGGMATTPAPLSFEALDRMAHRLAVADGEDFDRYLYLMLRMDAVYLAHTAQEMKGNKSQDQSAPQPGPKR